MFPKSISENSIFVQVLAIVKTPARSWGWKVSLRTLHAFPSHAWLTINKQLTAGAWFQGGTDGPQRCHSPPTVLQPRRPEALVIWNSWYRLQCTPPPFTSGKPPWATGNHVHFQGPHYGSNSSSFILLKWQAPFPAPKEFSTQQGRCRRSSPWLGALSKGQGEFRFKTRLNFLSWARSQQHQFSLRVLSQGQLTVTGSVPPPRPAPAILLG